MRHNLIHHAIRLMHAQPGTEGHQQSLSDAEIEQELIGIDRKQTAATGVILPAKARTPDLEGNDNLSNEQDHEQETETAATVNADAGSDDVTNLFGEGGALANEDLSAQRRLKLDEATLYADGMIPIGLKEVCDWQAAEDEKGTAGASVYYSPRANSANPVALYAKTMDDFVSAVVEPADVKMLDGTNKETFVVVCTYRNRTPGLRGQARAQAQSKTEVFPVTDKVAMFYQRFFERAQEFRNNNRKMTGRIALGIAKDVAMGVQGPQSGSGAQRGRAGIAARRRAGAHAQHQQEGNKPSANNTAGEPHIPS